MRTIETTIYTFDELSDEAKERAIEKISANVDGYLVSKQYMGYTKKEAVSLFQQEHLEG
jgi:hypothetical protein